MIKSPIFIGRDCEGSDCAGSDSVGPNCAGPDCTSTYICPWDRNLSMHPGLLFMRPKSLFRIAKLVQAVVSWATARLFILAVCFHVGGNSGDKSGCVNGLLQVELSSVGSVFTIL
jgi:hypothetical protein